MARWVFGMVANEAGKLPVNDPVLILSAICIAAAAMVALALCATHSWAGKACDEAINYSSGSGSSGSKGSGRGPAPAKSFQRLLTKLKVENKQAQFLEAGDLDAHEAAYRQQENELWGDHGDGLWHKAIILGERCEPPEFSGLILYDQFGNRVDHFPPKSPRHALSIPKPIQEQ